MPNSIGPGPLLTTTTHAPVSSITDPLSRASSFTYDAGGRLSRATQPDPDGAGSLIASFTNYSRDSLGNVLTTADAFGQTDSVTSRDAWFRALVASDPAGAVTSRSYDVFGNTTSVTDPLNNQTVYTYNKINELVTENKVGGGGNRTSAYDAVGNQRTLLDRNARTTTWNYDKLYRPIGETGVGDSLTYAYDAASRLTDITDMNPLAPDLKFVYDTRGQLQNELQNHELMVKNVLFDRDYDAVGNRTKLEANLGGTLPSTSIVGGLWDLKDSYVYDGMDRLSSATQTNRSGGNAVSPKLATFTYDAASQLTDLRRYSATAVSTPNLEVHSRMGYDLAGRLTSLTHGKIEIAAGQTWTGASAVPASLGTSNMLAAYFLTYDQDNRLTGFSSWRDAAKTTYAYDGTATTSTDQLASATSTQIDGMTLPFALPVPESYNVDANGNRKSSTGVSQSAPGTHNRLQTDGTFN